jgi:geranylgeranyl diphosphate synthase type I
MNRLAVRYYQLDADPDVKRYLYAPLEKYTKNGGKRHRPLICELGCAAVGGEPQTVDSAAAAIEHFHTAALIHDDIADESLTRHGKPCLHLSLGLGLAINAGDLALSQVTGNVLKDPGLDEHTKIRVLNELVDMTTLTIEGQALDIGWAKDARFDISIEDYLKMARRKTAYYSAAIPLAIGAIIGGGSSDEVKVLREFGMNCGLAFQIQDDVLNLIGKAESTKKDFRSDISEGKRTLIAVHALLNSPEHDELATILASHTANDTMLNCAVDLMQKAGSIDFAREYAGGLINKAKSQLASSLPASEALELLLSMADFFVERLG